MMKLDRRLSTENAFKQLFVIVYLTAITLLVVNGHEKQQPSVTLDNEKSKVFLVLFLI